MVGDEKMDKVMKRKQDLLKLCNGMDELEIHKKEECLSFSKAMLSIDGMKFISEKDFECNVSNYSSKDLTAAMHTDELSKKGWTFVRLDYKNSGLGSAACGPPLAEEYRLAEKKIECKFTMFKM